MFSIPVTLLALITSFLRLGLLLKYKSDKDSVDNYLRSRLNDSIQYVKVEKGLFVKGENKVIDKEVFKSKETIAPSNDYPFVFITGKMLSQYTCEQVTKNESQRIRVGHGVGKNHPGDFKVNSGMQHLHQYI